MQPLHLSLFIGKGKLKPCEEILSLLIKTFNGHKAIHIPQPLHFSSSITISIDLLSFIKISPFIFYDFLIKFLLIGADNSAKSNILLIIPSNLEIIFKILLSSIKTIFLLNS